MYKETLESFYILRSEIKFKGHELTLCDDGVSVKLKDLKTGVTYECNIYQTRWATADEFIQKHKRHNTVYVGWQALLGVSETSSLF